MFTIKDILNLAKERVEDKMNQASLLGDIDLHRRSKIELEYINSILNDGDLSSMLLNLEVSNSPRDLYDKLIARKIISRERGDKGTKDFRLPFDDLPFED